MRAPIPANSQNRNGIFEARSVYGGQDGNYDDIYSSGTSDVRDVRTHGESEAGAVYDGGISSEESDELPEAGSSEEYDSDDQEEI